MGSGTWEHTFAEGCCTVKVRTIYVHAHVQFVKNAEERMIQKKCHRVDSKSRSPARDRLANKDARSQALKVDDGK